MAGIGSRKLRASTLVEVLIAMVIIMAVFVTGIAIYTNVTQSGFSTSRLKAQQEMQKIINESISLKDWEAQELDADSILYKKTVSSYAGYPDLLLIEVKAVQNGRELGELRQIVKGKEE